METKFTQLVRYLKYAQIEKYSRYIGGLERDLKLNSDIIERTIKEAMATTARMIVVNIYFYSKESGSPLISLSKENSVRCTLRLDVTVTFDGIYDESNFYANEIIHVRQSIADVFSNFTGFKFATNNKSIIAYL